MINIIFIRHSISKANEFFYQNNINAIHSKYKNTILIYYITKMGKYSCEKCAKIFSQKSHYDKHLTRKNPCEIQTDKIKELIDKAVEEKLIELNKKHSPNCSPNCPPKKGITGPTGPSGSRTAVGWPAPRRRPTTTSRTPSRWQTSGSALRARSRWSHCDVDARVPCCGSSAPAVPLCISGAWICCTTSSTTSSAPAQAAASKR